MADYFDHFSFLLPLHSAAEAEWWNQVLARMDDQAGRKLAPDPEVDRLLAAIPELEATSEFGAWWGIDHGVTPPAGPTEGHAWFRATYGTPNIVGLARLTQAFLRRFRRPEGYGIESAMTCSKPRVDGFGGAAVWITARACTWLSTHEWLERRAARHERREKRRHPARSPRAASPASGPEASGRREKREKETSPC